MAGLSMDASTAIDAAPPRSTGTGSRSSTIMIGLSGPSSSGKTTIARLLRQIFNTSGSPASTRLKLFILHEDDFYLTDTQIPRRTVECHCADARHGTRELDDWDCVESLDLPLLKRVLAYVKGHGQLPEDFGSKEDQNSVGGNGISEEEVGKYRSEVEGWVNSLTGSTSDLGEKENSVVICVLDGFLLYPYPESSGPRAELHATLAPLLDLKLFIPGSRAKTITRRNARSGYVTLEGFWADPEGYVEDLVWPNYSRDHAWLFRSDDGTVAAADGPLSDEVREAIDAGHVNVDAASSAGILVGPGSGEVHLREILPWAVEEVKLVVRRHFKGT